MHWGSVGVAAAWTVSFWILTLPAFWYAGEPIHMGVGPVVSAVWKYVVASLAAGFATFAIMRSATTLASSAGAEGALLRLAVASLVFTVLYLVAIVVLHGGPEPIYGFVRLVPDMLPWRRAAKRALAAQASEASGDAGQADAAPFDDRAGEAGTGRRLIDKIQAGPKCFRSCTLTRSRKTFSQFATHSRNFTDSTSARLPALSSAGRLR